MHCKLPFLRLGFAHPQSETSFRTCRKTLHLHLPFLAQEGHRNDLFSGPNSKSTCKFRESPTCLAPTRIGSILTFETFESFSLAKVLSFSLGFLGEFLLRFMVFKASTMVTTMS